MLSCASRRYRYGGRREGSKYDRGDLEQISAEYAINPARTAAKAKAVFAAALHARLLRRHMLISSHSLFSRRRHSITHRVRMTQLGNALAFATTINGLPAASPCGPLSYHQHFGHVASSFPGSTPYSLKFSAHHHWNTSRLESVSGGGTMPGSFS